MAKNPKNPRKDEPHPMDKLKAEIEKRPDLCGIDGCTFKITGFVSYRLHLRNKHPEGEK